MDHPTDDRNLPRDPSAVDGRAALRRRLIDRRQALAPDVRRAADRAIIERMDAALRTWRAGAGDPAAPVLGVWWPIRGEPSLVAAFERWIAQGWRVSLPVVTQAQAPLAFLEWMPDTPMVPGPMAVPQPAQGARLQPDLLIVPCVGFCARGWRLGYGGGYYDRTLADRPVTAIGIAYDCLEITGFMPQAHDRRLDAVITETRLLRVTLPDS